MKEAAQLHHLITRIWVQGPDLTVCTVEAEMPRIPREADICHVCRKDGPSPRSFLAVLKKEQKGA